MFFFGISFIISFYFLEVYIAQSVYGQEVDLSGSLFVFNLHDPLRFYGLPLFLSALNHTSWIHFITNTTLFIICSAYLEKWLSKKQWLWLLVLSHLFGTLICLIVFWLLLNNHDQYIIGSSIIVFSFIGSLFYISKNKWLIWLVVIFCVGYYSLSASNTSALFTGIGHLAGFLFGYLFCYKLKIK